MAIKLKFKDCVLCVHKRTATCISCKSGENFEEEIAAVDEGIEELDFENLEMGSFDDNE